MDLPLTSTMLTVEVCVDVVENLVEAVEKSGMATVSPVGFWKSLGELVDFSGQKYA